MEYRLINQIDPTLTAVEQILTNRGIKDINHYIQTTDDDILDPALLMNMHRGATMLLQHIQNNDPIFIQIDSDCDGYTSAAVLINWLNRHFPYCAQNKVKYSLHDGKQHGLNPDIIPEGTRLVIAPDSSSNDYEIHQYLSENGIDVLVLDHHEADQISPYACIINNQLCDYPTKSLSGVGIVYKFCSYLDQFSDTKCADDFLDLVALGLNNIGLLYLFR